MTVEITVGKHGPNVSGWSNHYWFTPDGRDRMILINLWRRWHVRLFLKFGLYR